MIKKSKQVWEVGSTVRVGFLTLKVLGKIPTPGNGMPDEYALSNQAETKFYTFTPHNGLFSVNSRQEAFKPNY